MPPKYVSLIMGLLGTHLSKKWQELTPDKSALQRGNRKSPQSATLCDSTRWPGLFVFTRAHTHKFQSCFRGKTEILISIVIGIV